MFQRSSCRRSGRAMRTFSPKPDGVLRSLDVFAITSILTDRWHSKFGVGLPRSWSHCFADGELAIRRTSSGAGTKWMGGICHWSRRLMTHWLIRAAWWYPVSLVASPYSCRNFHLGIPSSCVTSRDTLRYAGTNMAPRFPSTLAVVQTSDLRSIPVTGPSGSAWIRWAFARLPRKPKFSSLPPCRHTAPR